MTNFEEILADPQRIRATSKGEYVPLSKDEWVDKKQSERKAVYEVMETASQRVGSNGKALQTYLDVQSQFEKYSVGNALVITEVMPEAKRLGDSTYWNENGAFIKKGAKSIHILEPGDEYVRDDNTVAIGFNVKKVFDVSQTNFKQQNVPPVQKDEKILIQALIYGCPATLKVTEDSLANGLGAKFEPEENIIHVQKIMTIGDMFRSISLELAHVQIADGDPYYDRNEHAFQAFCASYMLCKRNDISVEGYRFDNIPTSLAQMDSKELKGELTQIRDTANAISGRMQKVFDKSRAVKEPEIEGR